MRFKATQRLLPLLLLCACPAAFSEDDIDEKNVVVIKAELPTRINWKEIVEYLRSERIIDGLDLMQRGDLEKPPSQDNSNIDRCQDSTDNPVVLATGEKYKTEADFRGDGLYPLKLDRVYRSRHARGSLFGPHWPSTLDPAKLEYGPHIRVQHNWVAVPSAIVFIDPKGGTYVYTYKSHGPIEGPPVYDKNKPGTDKLPGPPVAQPAYYTYTSANSAAMGELMYRPQDTITIKQDQLTYEFLWLNRQLHKVVDHNGLELLRYDYGVDARGLPRPERITAAGGQTVVLSWGPSGWVESVRDPAGNNWDYRYESGMLAKVTAPGGTPGVRQYHYEDANRTRLTGITVGGQRYSSYAYYPDGKVSVSQLTGGNEKDTFVYGDKATTVTNAQGQTTKYTFVDVRGERKIRAISRESTSTCAAASALTEYDANGYIDYTLDWRGVKTDYRYDETGLLRELTTAAGTAAAQSAVYDWDGTRPTSTTHRDANGYAYASTTYTYHGGGREAGRPWEIIHTDLTTGRTRTKRHYYGFHGNGMLAATTIGRVWNGSDIAESIVFDQAGNISSATNAVGHITAYRDYTGLGQPQTVIDPNGHATALRYKASGLLEKVTAPGDLVTHYAYNADRQPTVVTYPDGSASRYKYDAAGRLEAIGNARSEYLNTTYDLATNSVTGESRRRTPSAGATGPIAAMPAASSSGRSSIPWAGRTPRSATPGAISAMTLTVTSTP